MIRFFLQTPRMPCRIFHNSSFKYPDSTWPFLFPPQNIQRQQHHHHLIQPSWISAVSVRLSSLVESPLLPPSLLPLFIKAWKESLFSCSVNVHIVCFQHTSSTRRGVFNMGGNEESSRDGWMNAENSYDSPHTRSQRSFSWWSFLKIFSRTEHDCSNHRLTNGVWCERFLGLLKMKMIWGRLVCYYANKFHISWLTAAAVYLCHKEPANTQVSRWKSNLKKVLRIFIHLKLPFECVWVNFGFSQAIERWASLTHCTKLSVCIDKIIEMRSDLRNRKWKDFLFCVLFCFVYD